ncbi:MAG: ATP-binding protein [Saprospiraceae bacterium]
MIKRIAEKRLKTLAASFRSVAVVGPRQSGKTTLCRMCFPEKPYVSLENPDERAFASEDPRGFLENYKDGAILDEVHKVPELFSYLQQILDETKKKGLFILTGSNHFLMQDSISQTLAGRIAYLNLLPLSLEELQIHNGLKDSAGYYMYKGFYPELYKSKIATGDWMQNYIRTFVERDVRQIKNINNLALFSRFLKLCATRVGQVLNLSSLANDSGVDQKTISSWISILESSFVIYLLKPFSNNLGKRLIKGPKLYFYDTGLASHLLDIENYKQIETHPALGGLFENLIISEYLKQNGNYGKPDNLFYWRDRTGHEIDLIQHTNSVLRIIEIKASKTYTSEFSKHLSYFEKLYKHKLEKSVIYRGKSANSTINGVHLHSWNKL